MWGDWDCRRLASTRAWWRSPILVVPPAFFILSMHSSNSPIFLPNLWPNSYYNTRYGMAALPLLAFGGAALVSLIPDRPCRAAGSGRAHRGISLAGLPAAGCVDHVEGEPGEFGHPARMDGRGGGLSRANYEVATESSRFGDLTGVVREAGIPLREVLHDGNNPEFDAVLARPDLFLHEEWALTISADRVATA